MTKDDKKLAKSALENMKRFKRNKQIEQATISFIVNQLVTKEERTELMKQFIAWDKNGDGVLSKEEIVLGYKNASDELQPKQIFNMQGVLLYQGDEMPELEPGVYIVRQGAFSNKVMITR